MTKIYFTSIGNIIDIRTFDAIMLCCGCESPGMSKDNINYLLEGFSLESLS